ncbi:MAG: YggS family pyridoxal phosphate-dependent enzyme [Bacteroidota bacterium]
MIASNVQIVKSEIEDICNNCGRKFDEITIIAVSKTKPLDAIKEAYKAGITDFGENKAQELRDKSKIIQSDFNWHFVGHLQTNKVKYVINSAEYIHSVDSVKLAEEINNKAISNNKIQKILIEVNTSGEDSKFGIRDFESASQIIDACSKLENIRIKGLMTMAPFTDDEKIIRTCFSRLREMKEKLNIINNQIIELSMGMTNDYKIAIEEGSTILRIGTAIFGQRDSSKGWRGI